MNRKSWALGLGIISTFLISYGAFVLTERKNLESNSLPPLRGFVPDDTALVLIDVLGDQDTIKAGSVTAECLSAKIDKITDQYEILLEKIRNQPSSTHEFEGLYVTLLPSGRRPIFQVRMPDRKYCAPFVEAYRACYERAPKESDYDKIVLPAGRCIQDTAGKLGIKEPWGGLVERYSPAPPQ